MIRSDHLEGPCILLENKLPLLYLVFRYHNYEPVLKSYFQSGLSKSYSPDTQLFKRIKAAWPTLGRSASLPGMNDPDLQQYLVALQSNVLSLFNLDLTLKQSEDDFKELLNLGIIFLGGKSTALACFAQSALFHHTRWMILPILRGAHC